MSVDPEGRDEKGRFKPGYVTSNIRPGAPRKFKSPEEMQAAVDAYFEAPDLRPTVTGLAFAIGLSRQRFNLYKHNSDEFAEVVANAKQRIEIEVEELLLYGDKPTGPIFNLKNNFGWKDALKLQHYDVDNSPVQAITKDMSPEEAAEAYKELMGD